MAFARNELSLAEFHQAYGNFYWELALDGHESDAVGLEILGRHARRIAVHRMISEKALSRRVTPEVSARMIREQAAVIASIAI